MALHEKYHNELSLPAGSPGWQRELPVLSNDLVTLRELRSGDATSLATQMADREVRRYIAPPPKSAEAFRQFIRWTRTQRRRGTHLTFGVVPDDEQAAVGIVQLWRIEPDFSTAEWGLAVGLDYWGRGLALSASTLLLDFAFTALDVHRLEARAGIDNVRGNRLLRRLGALPEGRLRQAFRRGGRTEDQRLWSILRGDWPGEAAHG